MRRRYREPSTLGTVLAALFWCGFIIVFAIYLAAAMLVR